MRLFPPKMRRRAHYLAFIMNALSFLLLLLALLSARPAILLALFLGLAALALRLWLGWIRAFSRAFAEAMNGTFHPKRSSLAVKDLLRLGIAPAGLLIACLIGSTMSAPRIILSVVALFLAEHLGRTCGGIEAAAIYLASDNKKRLQQAVEEKKH